MLAPTHAPTPETRVPAEPADYGKLNALYSALLAGLVLATRQRAAAGSALAGGELASIGAATFALSKLVAREKIGAWVRDPFTVQGKEDPRPAGNRLRHAVGELVTCTRCVGAWSALGLVGLRLLSPPTGRVVTAVLATSALNDFLQAGFRLLTEKADSAHG